MEYVRTRHIQIHLVVALNIGEEMSANTKKHIKAELIVNSVFGNDC